jgi:flavorubredoxin
MRKSHILTVSDHVKWIGSIDNDIVSFDIVMETNYGTTYNAYFIDAKKKTLVETVKESFHEEYLSKVMEMVDPVEIEYIVLNHTEPDHSGSLKHLLAIAPNAVVVGTGNAIRYLQEMIDLPFEHLQVKDGDRLDLGDMELTFIGAPNLHWPDTMYSFLKTDKVLFTCDSFGAHYAEEGMYDDVVGDFDEAFRYYFDVILKPYSKFMLKAIEKIDPLDINTICTGHGPILRSHWKRYVDWSREMASDYLASIPGDQPRVLVAYVSAYGYTAEMARAIADGIGEINETAIELVDIEKISPGDLEEKIVRSSAIIVGSPTINQNTLLPIYRLFGLINPLRDKGKAAAAFGSYGWSGEAVGIIENNLRGLKLNVLLDGVAFKFYPNQENREELVAFGRNFAKALYN